MNMRRTKHWLVEKAHTFQYIPLIENLQWISATGHKQWSKVNSSLYTICFTGKARKATRCDLCLSTTHKTSECSLAIDEDPDLGQHLKAVESAVIAFSVPSPICRDSQFHSRISNPYEKQPQA